jgi:hypothetical protein
MSNAAMQNSQPFLSSFIQIRSSIPFFWGQTASSFTDFTPDIVIDKLRDQKNLCTKRHFAKLFQKYSRNIICLNLTKKNNREGPLS